MKKPEETLLSYEPTKNIIFKDLFAFKCTYVCVFAPYVKVPDEARRGRKGPWSWRLGSCERLRMGAV